MNYFELEATFSYLQTNDDPEPIGDFVDRVTDHLIDLGAEDLHVVLDTDDRSIVLGVVAAAHSQESIETTIGKVMGTLRTAFHYCGAATPEWPTTRELIFDGVTVKSVDVEAAQDGHATGELAAI